MILDKLTKIFRKYEFSSSASSVFWSPASDEDRNRPNARDRAYGRPHTGQTLSVTAYRLL